MELNYFRDKFFNLLNGNEVMEITGLTVDERNNLLTIS